MLSYLKALKVAFIAHRGQKDKAGKPYIFHPIKVSFGVKGLDAKTVALLHDVIEDTNTQIESLMFLTNEQRKALSLLTHNKSVPYFEYVKKIKGNRIAKAVKLSDLRHNSNLRRLKVVSENDKKRVEKYSKAMELLLA